MCNDYRLRVDAASIAEDFADLKITIRFSEGVPNLEARDDIKVTDMAPIVRTIEGVRGESELVQRRWSWPRAKPRCCGRCCSARAMRKPKSASSKPSFPATPKCSSRRSRWWPIAYASASHRPACNW